MEKQKETVSEPKARPHRSLLNAARWALKIGFALALVLMFVIPETHADFLICLIAGGDAIWHVLFGPDRDSAAWWLALVALNGTIYSVLVFVAERAFVLWRRRLHPVDDNSHLLTR